MRPGSRHKIKNGRNTVEGDAMTPGYFSVVRSNNWDSDPKKQYRAVVHELFHNVVGKLDEEYRCGQDRFYTCSGWLSHRVVRNSLPLCRRTSLVSVLELPKVRRCVENSYARPYHTNGSHFLPGGVGEEVESGGLLPR